MTECTRCRRQYEDGVRFCPVDGFAAVPVGDPFLGRQLMGQFQLLSACGRGATGTVYRAQQTSMDRQVAVKILRADLISEPAVVKRFVREARAGARLYHPNIATVHLVGQTEDGIPYIVMEYIEGTPLSALCVNEGALPALRALHIAEQIASALAEAHDKNIVHRDLKPENVLLTERRGEQDVVKVVDFGIAKIVADNVAGEGQISRIGTIFGTPHYIAPEQASGAEVDARADIYSLGCILFQMVTGRVPFDGSSGIQVLLKHLREPAPNPRVFNPQVPEPLAALILRMLEKERAARIPSAEVLQKEIQRLREDLRQLPQQSALPTADVLLRLAQMTPEIPSPTPVATKLAPSVPLVPPAVLDGPLAPTPTPTPKKSGTHGVGSGVAVAPAPEPVREDDEAAWNARGTLPPGIDQEEYEAVLPWWRRRISLVLGGAAALGVLVGVVYAWRVHGLPGHGQAQGMGQGVDAQRAAVVRPLDSPQAAGALSKDKAAKKGKVGAKKGTGPESKDDAKDTAKDEGPEETLEFPASGPPVRISHPPAEALAPVAPRTTPQADKPAVPAAPSAPGDKPRVDRPQESMPPASPPVIVPAEPPAVVPATPPAAVQPAPEPPKPEPPKVQPPPRPQEEERPIDPYHMLN